MIDVLFLLLSMTEFALTFSLRSPALCTCLPTSYTFSSSVELPPSLFLFLSTLGIPSLTPLPSLLSSVFSDFSSAVFLSSSCLCYFPYSSLSLLCTIISLFPPPAFLCSAVPSSVLPCPLLPHFYFQGFSHCQPGTTQSSAVPSSATCPPPGLLLTPPISSLRPHLGFQTLTVPDRTPITIPGPP